MSTNNADNIEQEYREAQKASEFVENVAGTFHEKYLSNDIFSQANEGHDDFTDDLINDTDKNLNDINNDVTNSDLNEYNNSATDSVNNSSQSVEAYKINNINNSSDTNANLNNKSNSTNNTSNSGDINSSSTRKSNSFYKSQSGAGNTSNSQSKKSMNDMISGQGASNAANSTSASMSLGGGVGQPAGIAGRALKSGALKKAITTKFVVLLLPALVVLGGLIFGIISIFGVLFPGVLDNDSGKADQPRAYESWIYKYANDDYSSVESKVSANPDNTFIVSHNAKLQEGKDKPEDLIDENSEEMQNSEGYTDEKIFLYKEPSTSSQKVDFVLHYGDTVVSENTEKDGDFLPVLIETSNVGRDGEYYSQLETDGLENGDYAAVSKETFYIESRLVYKKEHHDVNMEYTVQDEYELIGESLKRLIKSKRDAAIEKGNQAIDAAEERAAGNENANYHESDLYQKLGVGLVYDDDDIVKELSAIKDPSYSEFDADTSRATLNSSSMSVDDVNETVAQILSGYAASKADSIPDKGYFDDLDKNVAKSLSGSMKLKKTNAPSSQSKTRSIEYRPVKKMKVKKKVKSRGSDFKGQIKRYNSDPSLYKNNKRYDLYGINSGRLIFPDEGIKSYGDDIYIKEDFEKAKKVILVENPNGDFVIRNLKNELKDGGTKDSFKAGALDYTDNIYEDVEVKVVDDEIKTKEFPFTSESYNYVLTPLDVDHLVWSFFYDSDYYPQTKGGEFEDYKGEMMDIKPVNRIKNFLFGGGGGAGEAVDLSNLSGSIADVINFAVAQVGKPYVWAANGPNAYDCSGLTRAAYLHVGVDIGHLTYGQEKRGRVVSWDEIQPGDLIFIGPPGNTQHVMMYMGNNKIVHAANPRRGIVIDDVGPNASWYTPDKFTFIRRYIEEDPYAGGGNSKDDSNTEKNNEKDDNENSNNKTSSEDAAAKKKVVQIALDQVGKPYVWAAAGPDAFDCSGLMLYAYREGMGLNLYHQASTQATYGYEVSPDDMQPGDMIFYDNNPSRDGIDHVSMYIGGGQIVHAARPGVGVVTQAFSMNNVTNIRRIVEGDGESGGLNIPGAGGGIDDWVDEGWEEQFEQLKRLPYFKQELSYIFDNSSLEDDPNYYSTPNPLKEFGLPGEPDKIYFTLENSAPLNDMEKIRKDTDADFIASIVASGVQLTYDKDGKYVTNYRKHIVENSSPSTMVNSAGIEAEKKKLLWLIPLGYKQEYRRATEPEKIMSDRIDEETLEVNDEEIFSTKEIYGEGDVLGGNESEEENSDESGAHTKTSSDNTSAYDSLENDSESKTIKDEDLERDAEEITMAVGMKMDYWHDDMLDFLHIDDSWDFGNDDNSGGREVIDTAMAYLGDIGGIHFKEQLWPNKKPHNKYTEKTGYYWSAAFVSTILKEAGMMEEGQEVSVWTSSVKSVYNFFDNKNQIEKSDGSYTPKAGDLWINLDDNKMGFVASGGTADYTTISGDTNGPGAKSLIDGWFGTVNKEKEKYGNDDVVFIPMFYPSTKTFARAIAKKVPNVLGSSYNTVDKYNRIGLGLWYGDDARELLNDIYSASKTEVDAILAKSKNKESVKSFMAGSGYIDNSMGKTIKKILNIPQAKKIQERKLISRINKIDKYLEKNKVDDYSKLEDKARASVILTQIVSDTVGEKSFYQSGGLANNMASAGNKEGKISELKSALSTFVNDSETVRQSNYLAYANVPFASNKKESDWKTFYKKAKYRALLNKAMAVANSMSDSELSSGIGPGKKSWNLPPGMGSKKVYTDINMITNRQSWQWIVRQKVNRTGPYNEAMINDRICAAMYVGEPNNPKGYGSGGDMIDVELTSGMVMKLVMVDTKNLEGDQGYGLRTGEYNRDDTNFEWGVHWNGSIIELYTMGRAPTNNYNDYYPGDIKRIVNRGRMPGLTFPAWGG